MCHTFLQGRMFSCSADCCSRPSDSMSQVHQCIDRCHTPLAQAQGLVTSELEKFQVGGVNFLHLCKPCLTVRSCVIGEKKKQKKKLNKNTFHRQKKNQLIIYENQHLCEEIYFSVLSCILCEILSLCVTSSNTVTSSPGVPNVHL